MANRQPGSALGYLRTLFLEGKATEQTDGQLLERFVAKRGESADAAHAAELAFATLVDRHGAMVWGVCRRVLRDTHEAEDAFQATFLVLVRKAEMVRADGSLGRWLYGVALRVSLRARSHARRRESVPLPMPVRSAEDPSAHAERVDLGHVVGEELDHLPETLRGPIELCDLQGMTYDQAARQLNWPTATVKSRLTRARLRLRERLSRRGLAATDASMAAAVPGVFRAAVPRSLVDSTIRAAGTRNAGAVPAAVAELTREVVKMMVLEKLRGVAAGVVIIMTLGVAALAQQSSRERVEKPVPTAALAQPADPAKSKPKPEADPRWTRTLTSGAVIEVVGVSPHPSGPRTWWGPDGKPLAEPPCDPVSTILSSTDPTFARAIVVRVQGLPAKSEHGWWIDEAQGGAHPPARLAGLPVPGLDEAVALFDGRQATATVRFRVAAGGWKTVQTWGTGPGSRGDRNGTSFIFSAPIGTAKGTALSVTHNIKDDSVRLVAVDQGGKEHPGETRSDGGAFNMHQLVGEFDLPPRQIQEFRVQTRPFEEVTIPEIPLKPARPD